MSIVELGKRQRRIAAQDLQKRFRGDRCMKLDYLPLADRGPPHDATTKSGPGLAKPIVCESCPRRLGGHGQLLARQRCGHARHGVFRAPTWVLIGHAKFTQARRSLPRDRSLSQERHCRDCVSATTRVTSWASAVHLQMRLFAGALRSECKIVA